MSLVIIRTMEKPSGDFESEYKLSYVILRNNSRCKSCETDLYLKHDCKCRHRNMLNISAQENKHKTNIMSGEGGVANFKQ